MTLWKGQESRKEVGTSNPNINVKRALFHAHEGHYGKSIRSLMSHGIGSSENPIVVREIHNRYPQHEIPNSLNNVPSSLTINPILVKAALQFFPKGSSTGSSKLRIQNLIDAICGTTSPAAQDCLLSLVLLIIFWLHGCVEHQ